MGELMNWLYDHPGAQWYLIIGVGVASYHFNGLLIFLYKNTRFFERNNMSNKVKPETIDYIGAAYWSIFVVLVWPIVVALILWSNSED